jgi:hypothetical protein
MTVRDWHGRILPTHGHTRRGLASRTYQTWKGMIQRTTNPNAANFPRFGGRGIAVCKRWRVFANFLADMGDRPIGMTLERKDGQRGYYRQNCRWATHAEQMRNRQNVGRPRGSKTLDARG